MLEEIVRNPERVARLCGQQARTQRLQNCAFEKGDAFSLGCQSATLGWNWRTLSALFICDKSSKEHEVSTTTQSSADGSNCAEKSLCYDYVACYTVSHSCELADGQKDKSLIFRNRDPASRRA